MALSDILNKVAVPTPEPPLMKGDKMLTKMITRALAPRRPQIRSRQAKRKKHYYDNY